MEGAAPQSGRRWRSSRRARTAAVVLGTAAVVATLVVGGFPFLGPSDAGAIAALRDAATVAAQAPTLQNLGDGYVYTRTDAVWLFTSEKFSYLRPITREFWMAADGSGRISETPAGEPIFLSDAEHQVFVDGGYQTYYLNEDFGPGQLEPLLGWEPLPTEPAELERLVRGLAEGGQQPIPYGMFTYIGDLLRDPLTPPEARAGLFEVAAGLPGIQLLGEMRDAAGREGLAVAMDRWFWREILIFDPATSALLEEQTVYSGPIGAASGPIMSRSTYLEAAVVPDLPARRNP
jgi:hypothetical protein